MRTRGMTIGSLLLVGLILLGALSGCQKAAPVRAPEGTATEGAAGTSVTSAAEEPATKETVVSAVITPVATALLPTAGSETVSSTAGAATATVVLEPVVVPTAVPVVTVPPTAPPSTGGEYETYVVQQGDTLAAIANRYGTTIAAIVAANGLENPNQITTGQELKIPTSGSPTGETAGGTAGCRIRHTVKQGEWVWQIARDYGVSPYDILKANNLTIQSADTIYAGMVLCIP
jgi:N-acetylmuramoyl-L-alanine amidase